ncbi:MAG: hypothetical protein H6575_10890 [Lewinellaceae bacterium]|nr:hypothetical protein [Lewinellaceae bacterium]
MKQMIIDLSCNNKAAACVASVLSFKPFHDFLIKKSASEKTVKKHLYALLLEKFREYPELLKPMKIKDTGRYVDVLELIFAGMTGITLEENEILWGISEPGPGSVFYGTDELFSLIERDGGALDQILNPEQSKEFKKREMSFEYSLILQRCYGIDTFLQTDMVYTVMDSTTHLPRYYQLNIDTRFIDVACRGKMPKLNFEELEAHIYANTFLDYLEKVMPLSNFTFTGVSIVSLSDVTEQHTVQGIKNSVLDTATKPKDLCVYEIVKALKTLIGCRDVDYGFIPFVRLNKKLLLEFGDLSRSVLLEYGRGQSDAEPEVLQLLEDFIKAPRPVFLKDISKIEETGGLFGALLSILKSSECMDFALIPLYYNSELTGALEVYTRKNSKLNDRMLTRLDAALPYVAQLIKAAIDDFHTRISRIVNEKFTSLQPSVQWKFNEAAFQVMYNSYKQQNGEEAVPIAFESLYPLYGAIDIRNSSVERNEALAADLRYQLGLLVDIIGDLKKQHGLALLDEMAHKSRSWLDHLNGGFSNEEADRIDRFLDREVLPALMHFKKLGAGTSDIVDRYCKSLDDYEGKFHENRRNLETSMQMINSAINRYFEQENEALQQHYPFYFEKFRTDGIEYDMFVGQSIDPALPFHRLYLQNLRLWQVQSMAEVCKMIQRMHAEMPKQLFVTHIIYVNSEPIDVSFRNDEKRFDVEGSYNIRYQMIKKRIDKVKIRDTDERLTQPGRIAIVYSAKADADEYVSYIRYLQAQHVLADDLERLELEELQGVSGLRALRVGVQLD